MALLTKLRNRAVPTKDGREERGAVLVLTALVMMLLLLIAAFSTDLGAWYRQGQEQQRAADVGALNGVLAYDTAVKNYFENNFLPVGSVKDWNNPRLTAQDKLVAEELGLRAAAETVIGLLEASGLTFTDTGSGTLAADPTDVNLQSVWTVVATDGTQIVITRNFVVTGEDAFGNNIYSRALSVDVVAPGEQYFSNIVRDAPDISRSASSVLSNCGATCNNKIEIAPPFAGFNASGSGDGYAPLLFNKDGNKFNGVEEIWAVNHHVAHAGTDSAYTSNGDIICMDTQTKAACLGGTTQFKLSTLYPSLQTPNRGIDYIDEQRGIILFVARDDALDKSGVVCFDARERQFCETAFLPLFDSIEGPGTWGMGGAWVNLSGPFVHGNKVYAFGQDGTYRCATLSDSGGNTTLAANCGSGNTPAANVGGAPMPDLQSDHHYMSNGVQIGDKLYMRQPTAPDPGNGGTAAQRLYCFDLDNGNQCWGGSGVREFTDFGYGADRDITFLSYNSVGVPNGICVARLNPGNSKNKCALLSNGNQFDIAGLSPMLNGISNGWGGGVISWQEAVPTNPKTRTFFAGGNSNMVGCWDWDTGDCGSITTDSAFTGAAIDWIAPYGFAQVSNNCVIGLSHRSVFYSFNPNDLSSCVETNVSTEITPCKCAEGGGNRWGVVEMPDELMVKTTKLLATVSATENGPPVNAALTQVNLHLSDGVLDLSSITDGDIVNYKPDPLGGPNVPVMYLRLEVDAKLKPNGDPEWETPIEADLAIVVQPTLTN